MTDTETDILHFDGSVHKRNVNGDRVLSSTLSPGEYLIVAGDAGSENSEKSFEEVLEEREQLARDETGFVDADDSDIVPPDSSAELSENPGDDEDKSGDPDTKDRNPEDENPGQNPGDEQPSEYEGKTHEDFTEAELHERADAANVSKSGTKRDVFQRLVEAEQA